jgi:hypothetical protein
MCLLIQSEVKISGSEGTVTAESIGVITAKQNFFLPLITLNRILAASQVV